MCEILHVRAIINKLIHESIITGMEAFKFHFNLHLNCFSSKIELIYKVSQKDGYTFFFTNFLVSLG